ncbi:hypothetical protein [Novosphingobium beihaiensis]|uniref:Uncharacterized protein n=1 Tax=Novosphingobium beihaiensis TaxID=2930389 RepID=A0ABT0BKG2_9SPHN|nr:hypothetical protein [Novosphingobium beihaiensis]MCJ2185343.1 hypothetical protein [Novosphingobium beihaiensis]
MKAKETGRLDDLHPGKPASGRSWELETIGALMALVWLLGAIQFIQHMM